VRPANLLGYGETSVTALHWSSYVLWISIGKWYL